MDAEALVDTHFNKELTRTSRFSPEVNKARRKERGWRAASAQACAKTILTKQYPDEYRALYLAAAAKIKAERGPLPGDD